MSWIAALSMVSPVVTLTEIGVSCKVELRLLAVTTISSITLWAVAEPIVAIEASIIAILDKLRENFINVIPQIKFIAIVTPCHTC